jgi:hypothetical protein
MIQLIHDIRAAVGVALIKTGVRILPDRVRKTVRGMLLYHVPGALSEDEKRDIREAAAEMRAR